jgi:hypothetical protein
METIEAQNTKRRVAIINGFLTSDGETTYQSIINEKQLDRQVRLLR